MQFYDVIIKSAEMKRKISSTNYVYFSDFLHSKFFFNIKKNSEIGFEINDSIYKG